MVTGTSITAELYQLLLTDLPVIQNINVQDERVKVLHNIEAEILRTINTYVGLVSRVDVLAHKCPNIKESVTAYGC